MEAVYFGSAKGGLNHGGAGTGPWIMADLEAGLWGSDVVESPESSVHHEFVTAMVKGGSGPAPVSDTAPTQDGHRQTHRSWAYMRACCVHAHGRHWADDDEAARWRAGTLCHQRRRCDEGRAHSVLRRCPPALSIDGAMAEQHRRPDAEARCCRAPHTSLPHCIPNCTSLFSIYTSNAAQPAGSIILGIGGDNSHKAVGSFYEGITTRFLRRQSPLRGYDNSVFDGGACVFWRRAIV
jgi:hypothetical protein